MEEFAYVLDYLPQGRSEDKYKEPIAQIIGENFFTLLEIIIKNNVNLIIGEKIFVGKGQREKVEKIKRRIQYDDLTSSAKTELKIVLEKIILEKEDYFIKFFNKCGPISIRYHQLELIPGIGKKHLNDILKERKKKEFENFLDLKTRILQFPEPQKMLAQRIEMEIIGKEKHYLFCRPKIEYESFKKKDDRFNKRY